MSDDSLVLGVLGGMGPAATVEFLAKLQAYTPAEKDQDHIRVIADINPKAPDRNTPGSQAGGVLAEMAGALRGAGAEVLAMPCNTAHAHADLIQRASGLPLVDMIDRTQFAVSTDATRYHLNGVYFEAVQNGVMRMTSTDGCGTAGGAGS